MTPRESAGKKLRKYICGGRWTNTTDSSDFDCVYDSAEITCDECIINKEKTGGNKMPKGMRWKMENR